jgi:hypothetical protein
MITNYNASIVKTWNTTGFLVHYAYNRNILFYFEVHFCLHRYIQHTTF